MDRIDPARVDLARQFHDKPFGPHGPELLKLLSLMRWLANEGKPVVVCTEPHREWCVGELPARRGMPVVVHDDHRFDTLEGAFRAVFDRRWRLLTGEQLRLD